MKNIKYKYWNLGTFVYQAKAPDHVVKRLLDEGNKKLESYKDDLIPKVIIDKYNK